MCWIFRKPKPAIDLQPEILAELKQISQLLTIIADRSMSQSVLVEDQNALLRKISCLT